MGYHVYDDRTNMVLFSSEDELKCVNYMNEKHKENKELADHIWLKLVNA